MIRIENLLLIILEKKSGQGQKVSGQGQFEKVISKTTFKKHFWHKRVWKVILVMIFLLLRCFFSQKSHYLKVKVKTGVLCYF